MKRLIRLLLISAAAGFVIRRLNLPVRFGTVVLDDAELSQHVAAPLDLIVVGLVMIPAGTSTGLAAAAIKRLRVVGLLDADRRIVQALTGRVTAVGAIHSGD